MELFLNVVVTLFAGFSLVPAIFRGKMKDNVEIAFLIGGLMCLAFSILIAVQANYFSITACIGATSLLLSAQGRAFLIEIGMMPFEFVAWTARRTRNFFMAEKLKKDWEFWRDVREDLFDMFGGVQNRRMEETVE